ncbi:MAG: hypothetical protein K2Q12_03390, partial [Rickettsiales bacterium]|nr:hypothetical protein [Rickettsiales bacterium]
LAPGRGGARGVEPPISIDDGITPRIRHHRRSRREFAHAIEDGARRGHHSVEVQVVVEGDGIAGITLDSQLRVACGQGALQILKLQRQGKAAIAAEDMLRGYAIPAGTDLN